VLDVLFKINFNKINEVFNPEELKAGILYNSEGFAVDKILFYEKNGIAKEVWNDMYYSLNKDADYYIDDIVYLDDLYTDFFGYGQISFAQLLMGYKMFLNDSNYLYRHYEEFGMFKREVGYKGKEEIVPDPYCRVESRQNLFNNLLKIINYRDINIQKHEKVKAPLF